MPTYQDFVEQYLKSDENGRKALVITTTATPTSELKRIVGEPVFEYSLSEYLASEYAPQVEYRMITHPSVTAETIDALKVEIEQASKIIDDAQRTTRIKEIRDTI